MPETLIEITTNIVSAYVLHNNICPDDLIGLIKDVHGKLASFAKSEVAPAETARPSPHMPWKKTIQNDYLVSLEDGKHYKALKRHLTRLGMTPNEYNAKWSLPKDYPLICESYSARRSELAQSIGLGRRPIAEAETVSQPEPRMVTVAPKNQELEEAKTDKQVTPILRPKDRKRAKVAI